jgi:hypothetical protein
MLSILKGDDLIKPSKPKPTWRKFWIKYALFAGFGVAAVVVLIMTGNPVGFESLIARAVEALGEAAADTFGEDV